MGEGWSDAFAVWTEQKSATVADFTIGSYVIDDSAGIRSRPYSLSASVNPIRYSTIRNLNEVHDIGEVWATTLYEVLWNLIDKHGKNDGPKPEFDSNGVPTDGKYLTLKLVVDAMAL